MPARSAEEVSWQGEEQRTFGGHGVGPFVLWLPLTPEGSQQLEMELEAMYFDPGGGRSNWQFDRYCPRLVIKGYLQSSFSTSCARTPACIIISSSLQKEGCLVLIGNGGGNCSSTWAERSAASTHFPRV